MNENETPLADETPVADALLQLLDILDSVDIETKAIHVPEWGGNVLIRKLTTGATAELEDWRAVQDEGKAGTVTYRFMCHYIAVCLADEKGNRLITPDTDMETVIDRLMEKDGEAVGNLFLECRLFNGWKPEDDQAAETPGKP